MTNHRASVRPAQPGRHLRRAQRARAARRSRRGGDELRDAGRPVVAGAAADPRADRVVVGLREGAAAARRALRGVRRRPSRPGPKLTHARSLHPRQLRQRPGPLHRPGHRTADHRQRPVVGRRPLRVAVGVRQARSGRRRGLRGPAAVLVRGATRDRARDPVRASARCSPCGAPTSATSGRSAPGTRCATPRPSGSRSG